MQLSDIRNITILGTGMMGPGIALLFARTGYNTIIWGPNEEEVEKGRAHFRHNVNDLLEQGIFEKAETNRCFTKTRVTSDWHMATREADFVVEAILEIVELKQDIFVKLENSCPQHTILTSNTSTLLPTDIAAKMRDKSRFLVAHFWNPAHLVPLVEVCGHPGTRSEAIALTMQLLTKIGNEPVHIKKELLGFIGNRIMHAMNREALALVSNGICSAEDIDKVVLAGFGPRFANLGLLEYLDFVGLDHIQRIQKYLYADLDVTPGPLPVINEKVKKGELGCKTGKGLFDWSHRDPEGPRTRRDQEFLRRKKEEEAKAEAKE
ncbi:3-hydroxyacyl-CoA dehydrogenase family protein [candidate division KSB1 bacterium]|nr:3-hydroxyacyl-CoA dehydrogenase family protein [candidate division KSB1 bacterium]RQW05568.1 MAG: 3-hydroxyacyl-CoA dehydrogenase family protein [candidate division KSB1 bacterium]